MGECREEKEREKWTPGGKEKRERDACGEGIEERKMGAIYLRRNKFVQQWTSIFSREFKSA